MDKRTASLAIALGVTLLALGATSVSAAPDPVVPFSHGDPSFQCERVAGRIICVAVLESGCTAGLVYAGSGGCYVEGQGGATVRAE